MGFRSFVLFHTTKNGGNNDLNGNLVEGRMFVGKCSSNIEGC